MKFICSCVVGCACALAALGNPAKIVRDVPYDAGLGVDGLGDLHYPKGWTADTPVALLIHGGGWTGLHRPSVEGIARYLVEDLGMAAYNIEYRLASKKTPWPACGDDCVKAAKWLLAGGAPGLKPRKIWVIGGSAGGHLTLWTALSLPPEQLAGAISISGIADPAPDFAAHPGRYHALFRKVPEQADFDSMNPLRLIRRGQSPILLTHADADKVVPIASARAFEKAYKAAGNRCDFLEYSTKIQPGLTGHCIWIPGSKPHRLIPSLEKRITEFIREGLPKRDAH